MSNGDTKLAQAIYLANMYAQRKECDCQACKLLRQATDGMIQAFLGGAGPGQGLDMTQLVKQAQGQGQVSEALTGEDLP